MYIVKPGCLLFGFIFDFIVFNNLYGKTVIQIFFLNLPLEYKKFITQDSSFLLQFQPKQIAYDENYFEYHAFFCFFCQ